MARRDTSDIIRRLRWEVVPTPSGRYTITCSFSVDGRFYADAAVISDPEVMLSEPSILMTRVMSVCALMTRRAVAAAL